MHCCTAPLSGSSESSSVLTSITDTSDTLFEVRDHLVGNLTKVMDMHMLDGVLYILHVHIHVYICTPTCVHMLVGWHGR